MLKCILLSLRSNAIGWIALFVALGGSGYAAQSLSRNSVGAKQLRNGAVTSAKVRDGTLDAKDFKGGVLNTGSGATGAAGAKGDTGERGSASATNVVVRAKTESIAPGTTSTVTATCNSGEKATGGGIGPQSSSVSMHFNRPANQDGSVVSSGEAATAWAARGQVSSGEGQPPSLTLTVYVICASP